MYNGKESEKRIYIYFFVCFFLETKHVRVCIDKTKSLLCMPENNAIL